jgi:hypothetical protein
VWNVSIGQSGVFVPTTQVSVLPNIPHRRALGATAARSSSTALCHDSPSQSTLRSEGNSMPLARAWANHSRNTLVVPPIAVTLRRLKKLIQSLYSSLVTEPSAITWQPDRSAKAAARKCAPHMRPAPQQFTKTSSRSSGRHCSYTPVM